MRTGVFEIMQMGGPVMWLILAGSIIALGVFLERVIFYHRCSVPVGPFLKGMRLLLGRGDYKEALERCDDAYGPAIKVVQAAIVKRDLRKPELREVIQEVAQLQMPRIEANLLILSTIAHVMPLLGLFGTVTGMIEAFQAMNEASGATPIGQLAGGIWEALVTTAAGLAVAIPAYVGYNYLNSRVSRLIGDMERAGIEVLQLLKEPLIASIPVPELDSTAIGLVSHGRSVGDGKPDAAKSNDPVKVEPPKPSGVNQAAPAPPEQKPGVASDESRDAASEPERGGQRE